MSAPADIIISSTSAANVKREYRVEWRTFLDGHNDLQILVEVWLVDGSPGTWPWQKTKDRWIGKKKHDTTRKLSIHAPSTHALVERQVQEISNAIIDKFEIKEDFVSLSGTNVVTREGA